MYYLTTSFGLRGYFAVLVDDSQGFPEPINTGFGSYITMEQALEEAKEWAAAEGLTVKK